MKKKAVAVFAALTLGMGTGIAVGAVSPVGINGPGLAAVGPVSPADGLPVWYKDNVGLRLEACGVWVVDPMCPAVAPLPSLEPGAPNPLAPISFPTNFPPEIFYTLTAATMDVGLGKALGAVQLEGGLPTPVDGAQVTFARVRYIIDAQAGQSYKITSPAGTKTLIGDARNQIKDTEDIGIGSPGDFTGALGGRVGPFLTWDTFKNAVADPALKPNLLGKPTYIGDPLINHKIIGSPYNTNFFRIEGPGINKTPTVDMCPTILNALADCMETDLFSVQGKLATTSGVTADQATYSRSAAGTGVVDVFASSLPESQQAIQVTDVPVAPALPEFTPTALAGSVASDGHYFARVTYTGAEPPTTVMVSNISDVPVANKNIKVVDRITGTAVYTTGAAGAAGSLTITAVSSDTLAPVPALAASGFAAGLPVPLVAGVLTVPIDAPPVAVTVTSAKGGTVRLPVVIGGAAVPPVAPVAMAGPDQNVGPRAPVTLDGSASTGAVTYAWTGPAGITILDPNLVKPTFTAPVTAGLYVFSLTATGPGGSSTATVTVTVDGTIPGIPVIGVATAGDTTATVSWTAPPVSVPPVTGYSVRVVNSVGAQVGALRPAAAGATSLAVTGLTNATPVSFQVAATNASVAGTSTFSALSNVVTPAALPGAPVIGVATAGVASATVNWTAPANAATSAITGYAVRTFIGGVQVGADALVGNVLTLNVPALTNGTTYTFDVLAINAMGTGPASGFSAAVTPRSEFIAPTVTARSPAIGARTVNPAASLTATFSEPVVVNATTFVVKLGTVAVPAAVTYNGLTGVATLVPTAALAADSVYSVSLAGVTDVAGNPLVAVPWTFTTGPAPTITGFSPAAGATGVGTAGNVTVNFSETITGFSATTVRLTRLNGNAVASVVSYNPVTNVLTIDPVVDLAKTVGYRVLIIGSNTAVRDLVGNPLPTKTWTFTTGLL